VTFRAGPRVNIAVSGDWESAGGSIIIPLHVNCRASSANTATLVKHKISDAKMLVRNIDTASDLGGQIDKVNHHRYAAIILSFVAALRT
jgi:hypothetical protein